MRLTILAISTALASSQVQAQASQTPASQTPPPQAPPTQAAAAQAPAAASPAPASAGYASQPYQATVVSASFHHCAWTFANGAAALTQGDCTYFPTHILSAGDFAYADVEVKINGAVRRLIMDSAPHSICIQTADEPNPCPGSPADLNLPSTQVQASFNVGNSLVNFESVVRNALITQRPLTMRIVPGAMTSTSWAVILNASNVRLIDDGSGDTFPVQIFSINQGNCIYGKDPCPTGTN
jgi:hypothetical protein